MSDEEPGSPLPRRAGRTHLEPQLRERRGAGSGTPFAAFDGTSTGGGPDTGDAPDPTPDPDPAPGAAGSAPESRAATFRAAVRRVTGRPPRRTD